MYNGPQIPVGHAVDRTIMKFYQPKTVAPTNAPSEAAGCILVVSFPVWTINLMSTDDEVQLRCESAWNSLPTMVFPVTIHYSARRCLVERRMNKKSNERFSLRPSSSGLCLGFVEWRSHPHLYLWIVIEILKYIYRHVQRSVKRNSWSMSTELGTYGATS